MSTLTKILIVLLTLSSIFLCGIVVTYVGNADNYKQEYNNLKSDRDSLSKKEKDLTKQVNEKIEQKKLLEDKLTGVIASLKAETGELQGNLREVERERATLLQKVGGWTSVVESFAQTIDEQGQLLKNTLEELNKLQTEQVKQRRELNETAAALIEKMAIIETLEAENRRLLEEKAELQGGFDRHLQPAGRAASAPAAVTPRRSTVRPARPVTRDIDLRGLVTAVDLKNSVAEISVGSVDGVREGMKFHVVRGDEFICDVLIIDVEPEKAVGVLELVQQQPRVGDNVSTNL